MYYVPDGTKTCGYYECKKCGNRFLSLQTMEKIPLALMQKSFQLHERCLNQRISW